MKKVKIIGALAVITMVGFSLLNSDNDTNKKNEETIYSMDQNEINEYHNNGFTERLFGDSIFLDAKIDSFETLSDVEKSTDIIVIAEKISQDEPTVIYNSDDRIDIAYTLSQFKIDQVIEGKAAQEGTTLTLLENEAYDDKVNLTYHISGYHLTNKGEKYLLFLRQSETDPYYLISGVNYGKVSLDKEQTDFPEILKHENTVFSNEILSEYQHQEKIRQEAREKYEQFIN